MTNRSDGHDDELVRALDELFADDVFLTELSRGVDVSDGEDPYAAHPSLGRSWHRRQ